MHLFLFRPYCYFERPFLDCSDGWALYQFLGLLVAFGYRQSIASVLWLAVALAVYYGLGYGVMGMEIVLHFCLGTFFGVWILRRSKPAPPIVAGPLLHNYTGAIVFTAIVAVASLAFAFIDERIIENNGRYGVVGAFVAAIGVSLLMKYAIHVVNHVHTMSAELNSAYYRQWNQFLIAVGVIMSIALLDVINSYVKGGLTFLLVPLLLYLYEQVKY